MCLKPHLTYRRISKQLHRLLHKQPTIPDSTAVTSTPGGIQYFEPPDKSKGDRKLYRALKLPNGLRAMLICDPTPSEERRVPRPSSRSDARVVSSGSSSGSLERFHGKLAACAVLIDVGSFSEPQQYQGLAHFLEHMIFMGSEKYPEENAFDVFVTKNGGFSNAHTDNEETCFYFEVGEASFDKCLDYFMNLMKHPLMQEDSMTRERLALQAEFEQTYMHDDVRRDQVLASMASDGYPHGTFGWGNLRSLQHNVKDSDLHKMLHDFQRKHYGANRMLVCMQSQLTLDQQEELLVRHCMNIPQSQESIMDTSKLRYDKAFRERFYKHVLLVQPIEDICKLELTWVLPPMQQHYRCKPDVFMSQLLGYEGVGSLCAYLRRRLWCMTVMAGVGGNGFESNSFYSLFNLTIFLTDDGFEHLDEVMAATFAWIKLFNDYKSLRTSYREIQQIAATNFRFQFESSSIDNVQDVVTNMNKLPPQDVLTGSQLYYEFDEAAVQLVMQHLSKFHFNIMISSHIPYENHEYDKREPWFGTSYTTIPIPTKWVDMWDNTTPLPELSLPASNPFVTTDFRLHWHEAGKPHIPRRPKTLVKNEMCELWFRQDDSFELPDGYINIYFLTPTVQESATNYMLSVLFTYLVEFSIVEQLYPALEAGLTYGLYTGDKGLILRVNGYNQNLPLLLDIILKEMRSLKVDMAQLISFKELKKRQIFNTLINAKSLNLDLRLQLLEDRRFSMLEKYEKLESIQLEDMLKFRDNWFNKGYIQALIQGNFTEEQALSIMHNVLSTYEYNKIPDLSVLNNRLVQLPIGTHYLRVKTLNDQDTNSIVTNYYQLGPCNLRLECLMDLIEMIVEEPFFNQLRTQEQLGYSLGISQRIGYGVLAYVITVNTQEPTYGAAYVNTRIEAFRNRIPDLIARLSDEDFLGVRETLSNSKKLGDTSLDEEVARNWSEITTMEYFFNRLEMLIRTLASISKQDLLDFLSDNEQNNFRKLSVQVVGNGAAPSRTPTDSIGSNVSSRHDVMSGPAQRPGPLSNLIDEMHRNISSEQLLFEQIGDKIKLKYIGEHGNPEHIMNIAEFKKNLHVYPLINTNPKLTAKSDLGAQAVDEGRTHSG